MKSEGFLLVFSDVKREDEGDYLKWLTTEHVQERLSIEGFLAVRVFRRPIAEGGRYFIWYRLAGADVVGGAAYLERLNDPTPWSQRIMPILGNFVRGGGMVAASSSEKSGEHILAVRLPEVPSDPRQVIEMFGAGSGITAANLLVTDRAKSDIRTNEKNLRANDQSFIAMLTLESMDEHSLNAVLPALSKFRGAADGPYEAVYSLAVEQL